MLAFVAKNGHVVVDNVDVTEALRKQSVCINDAVGNLSLALCGGSAEIILCFRDLLGAVISLRGNAALPEKFRLVQIGGDCAGDPVVFSALFGFEAAWVGTDGALHRASL